MRLTAPFICILLAAQTYAAEIPELLPWSQLSAGGSPIMVQGGYSIPEPVDWNADGRKDLLVGQYTNGKTQLFLNSGADSSPALGAGKAVQSGGADIQVPDG